MSSGEFQGTNYTVTDALAATFLCYGVEAVAERSPIHPLSTTEHLLFKLSPKADTDWLPNDRDTGCSCRCLFGMRCGPS